MKKLVLVGLIVFAFALSAVAQTSPIDKKSWFLGGSIYFETQSGDLYKAGDESPTTIMLAPEFGYFIAPSIQIGASVIYDQYKIGDYKATAFAFGPSVGYYFNMNSESQEIKGGLYPYIKGFFLIGSEKQEGTTEDDFKSSGTSFGGKVGLNYMLSESVAIDANVMFSSDSWKQKEPVETESVSGTTMRIGVGATYFIWK
jgi:opacity protein-like surface antigen